MQSPPTAQRQHRRSPATDSDQTVFSSTSSMTDDAGSRTSSASNRSTGGQSRRPMNPQQQLSQIEKSVTHLLVATKQLLETLTLWSRGTATESEVSDVYVRLGYEFNIASRAFNAIGVDTTDLGNVPELLRSILEETLSQEASQASLDRFLPRIRDIIINLLHGLKKKQQRLRQRSGRDSSGSNGSSSRHASVGEDDAQRQRLSSRQGSADLGHEHPDLPPRTSSAHGRASPNKYESPAGHSRVRSTTGSRDGLNNSDSSLSSNTTPNIPIITPYPEDEGGMPATNPSIPENFPPPPPPPKQQDALAALQRGGELERRASRRFSAYQIQKHLGASNGIPMMPPSQNSPIPNRGRDVRESMNAVRKRGSLLHSRKQSTQQAAVDASPSANTLASRRISEESSQSDALAAPSTLPPTEEESSAASATDSQEAQNDEGEEKPAVGGAVSEPVDVPAAEDEDNDEKSIKRQAVVTPTRSVSHKMKPSTPPQSQEFIPDQSPQPGKELTLFLQYKSKIKKFVLQDGYNDLSIARLQLAFIEKFAWNTHNNGVDLPEIYIQDPISGVRHELEDLSDIKDRAVLVLNVEALDEVKRHFDDGLGDIRKLVESVKSAVVDQQLALQRVSDRQAQAAKEMAGLSVAPSARSSIISPRAPAKSGSPTLKDSAAQLDEIQSLRRDLAVVRQTYSSFVSDIEASMGAIRSKASSVKSAAINAEVPTLSGETGRSYVNKGKKTLNDDSEKIVNRVDDLQDLVEDLRKDVVSRGVRPRPRQLEAVAKEISITTAEVKKLQDFLKKEKPVWTKLWEQELQMVMEDREMLTMQEELALDLQDDLEKLSETFGLVEQATKQQNSSGSGNRHTSGRNMHAIALDTSADPREAKDGMLNEVRALEPNHESRVEAIERAEKIRQKELESRKEGEFQRELGKFVEEGKLKKSGGVEEVERLRLAKDEKIRKEVFELQAKRAAEAEERRRQKAEARRQAQAEAKAAAAAAEAADGEAPKAEGDSAENPAEAEATEEKKEEQAPTENGGENASS
ncbi:Actin interacting protein 3 [Lasiodiplodia theobromae]|uniref:Actin interacting protein 3 n=1 Tax=Lasiodiplodia theobromae TaxID=45133 RepID=UPI0015C3A690|nr:Actin interacting protein 3 [Lasiodiplodia theobromae]KAF4536535.1 Actin interacting protein 3 [Lasiodiplodia theobromae]